MSPKIRVLAISHSGVVAENNKLWDHLARDDRFELTLLVPPRYRAALRDHVLEKASAPNYTIVPARTLFSRSRFSNHTHIYAERVRRLLHDGPPDVVFAQEEPWSLVMQQVVLLRNRRSRLLFWTAQNQVKRYPFPFNLAWRSGLRASDGAVVLCEEAGNVLRRHGYAKPVHYMPLGVDTESFVPSPGRRRGLRRRLGLDGFVIGYVGRLIIGKGILDLLGALARLGPDSRLLIAGDGPDRARLLHLAERLGLGGRVVMAGVVPHSDIPFVLPAMDVLALPSHTTRAWKEQFGRVLIEAMSCGVPVIGSDSAEIPRTIGEAGLVFPEGDEARLAEALERLRSCPELRDFLVRKGMARAREFSWPAVARRLARILQETMETRRTAAGPVLAA